MFGAIFNIANSSLNIMDGSAFNSDKEKSINQAIFGKGPKANLGDGLLKHYGVGSQGFDVGWHGGPITVRSSLTIDWDY